MKKFSFKNRKRFAILIFLIIAATLGGVLIWYFGFSKFSAATATSCTFYVDATDGVDANTGTSPGAAWKTVTQVNRAADNNIIQAGNMVCFQRGEVWDGANATLVPKSGTSGSLVTYSAYGSGAKPVLSMARDRSLTTDWIDVGNGVWQNGKKTPIGAEMLPNTSFSTDTTYWSLYTEDGAAASMTRTTSVYRSSPGALKIHVDNGGNTPNDIQLTAKSSSSNGGFTISRDKYYEFSYWAKTSAILQIPKGQNLVELMQLPLPNSNYNNDKNKNERPTINPGDWQKVSMVFVATKDATDAIIKFNLGRRIVDNDATIYGMLNDSDLYLDDVSFKEINRDDYLYVDPNNITMNSREIFGNRVWARADLVNGGDYWFDIPNKVVQIKSVDPDTGLSKNPALVYSDIELSMKVNIVDYNNKSYAVFDGLHTSMGYFGFTGDGDYITIQNCDISYIGGGLMSFNTAGNPVRGGNGIEFWNASHNNLVQNNRIWEVYDAALTTQGFGGNKYSEYFYNNITWNCGFGFEFWHHKKWKKDALGRDTTVVDVDAAFHDIRIENNIFHQNGYDKFHGQRPDKGLGTAFLSYGVSADTYNIFIRNNIFGLSRDQNIYFKNLEIFPWLDRPVEKNIIIDNNLFVPNLEADYRLGRIYETTKIVDGVFLLRTSTETRITRMDKLDDWNGLPYNNRIFNYDLHSKEVNDLHPFLFMIGSFRLHPQSLAINNGADISNHLTKDIIGTTRPQGSAYDIGAYEELPYTLPTLNKQVDKTTAAPREQIKYTITFTNISGSLIQNIVVGDDIPANSTLVPGSITGGGRVVDGKITWSVSSLAPNASVQYEFKVTAN